ncbi:MAG TPA: metallopeptidase family protein [Candidatus Eisenbacteria bacterium]
MSPEDALERLCEDGEQALDDGEFEAALATFDEVLSRDAEHWGAALRRAECLLLLWRTREALEAARGLRPPEEEGDDPDRADLEARILEAMGRFSDAEHGFTEAHRLDPDSYPLPVRLSRDDFQRLLTRVLESMPEEIRTAVAEVPVVVEPKPTAEMAGREPHIHPEILGLFVGTPVGQRVQAPSGYGDLVLLFQRNLERAGATRAEVEREVRITLLHEYGHYLGFDEEDMDRLGLA